MKVLCSMLYNKDATKPNKRNHVVQGREAAVEKDGLVRCSQLH